VFYDNTSKNSVNLTATVTPSDATDKRITWSQENINNANNVAATLSSTTDTSITVTAGSLGRAQRKITVTTTDGSKTASIIMIACDDVTNYKRKIVSGGASLYKGPSTSSYGNAIATISAGTEVEISAEYGSDWAYIQNPNQSGQWGYVQISMFDVPATGVTAKSGSTTLDAQTPLLIYKDDSKAVTVTIQPSNATNKNYSWTTSPASSIATRSGDTFTGKAEGKTSSTVTTSSGSKTASFDIIVITKLASSTSGKMTGSQYLWTGPSTNYKHVTETALTVDQGVTIYGSYSNYYYISAGGNYGFVAKRNVILNLFYQINQLHNLAKQHESSRANLLTFQFLRSGLYDNARWDEVAGSISSFQPFLNYVNKQNSSLNLLRNTRQFYTGDKAGAIDFTHMTAVINGILFESTSFQSWAVGEQAVNDLCGWAGDLQSHVIDTIKATNATNDYPTFYNKFMETMGTSESRYSMEDLMADADAVNLTNGMTTSAMGTQLNTYYIGGNADDRYTLFINGRTKSDFADEVYKYTKNTAPAWGVIPTPIQWPLYKNATGGAVTVTTTQAQAARDAYVDYIWSIK
jgi:uncharacterized protein YjdB